MGLGSVAPGVSYLGSMHDIYLPVPALWALSCEYRHPRSHLQNRALASPTSDSRESVYRCFGRPPRPVLWSDGTEDVSPEPAEAATEFTKNVERLRVAC